MSSAPDSEALRLLREFAVRTEYALLTTRAGGGALVSRPLQTLDVDGAGTLWFFTSARSGKVAEIAADARVNLAYADPQRRQFLSLAATARCSVDRARIDALWRPAQTIFFPQGRDDPDLVLLQIVPHAARWWDGNEGIAGLLWKFGRALALGEASDLGTSARYDLDRG